MKNRDVRACRNAAQGWCFYANFSCAQPVTYQSLAREAGLPYDLAKALLFEFFTQHKAVRCVALADMRARVHAFASRLSEKNGWPSACFSDIKFSRPQDCCLDRFRAQKLHATFLLSGWTKDGDAPRHRVSVVRGDELEGAKARFNPITSMHLYSLGPAANQVGKDAALLKQVPTEPVSSQVRSQFKAPWLPTERG